MSWFYLIIAGCFEVIWAFHLKSSNSFSELCPTIILTVSLVTSLFFLSLAMRVLPMDVAYISWVGVGCVGTFIINLIIYDNTRSFLSVIAIILIILGLVMIKADSG
jgi:quaternary ammonium compound-resistance protein SugE